MKQRSCSAGAGGMVGSVSGRIHATAVGIQDGFDVKLLFVAEMIIDRRDVGPSSFADRSNSGRVKSLSGELLARRLDQPNLRRILCFHFSRRFIL